jgi:hypothetical protein
VPTKRQNILDNIKATIENISSVKSVEIDRMVVTDYTTVAYPCVFIYSNNENRTIDGESGATIGNETWSWDILIEVWAKNYDIETLLGEIHSALYQDTSRGGNALLTYRKGVEFFYIDPMLNLKGMSITFTILYSHPVGSM